MKNDIDKDEWIPLKEAEMISYDEDYKIEEDMVRNIPKDIETPYDFYSLFINESFINYLVENTNNYGNYKKNKNIQKKEKTNTRSEKWRDINYSDMEKFIATLILMGLHKLPEYRDHFSKEPLLGTIAQKFLNQWSYELICSHLHASKPKTKGKDKISYLINDIISKSQKYYYPSTCVTIDERMISYKGKNKYVVYEPSKPTRFGFRPYVLSDYKSGYTYCLQLLEDLDDEEEENNDNNRIYNMVMSLMCGLIKNNITGKKHILATDGLYTSEKLLSEDSFNFIGQIRYNRIKYKHEEITKYIKKGSYQQFYKIVNGKYLLLTKYMDNKLVLIVSNFLNSSHTLNRYRWDKKEMKFNKMKYPEVIKIYSNLMKGVDIGNQLISYYELKHKTYKWWKRILYHLIDISIVNSYIIYKKYKNKNYAQKDFRIEILKSIIYKYALVSIKNYEIKNNNLKNSNKVHLVSKDEKRGTCVYCSKTKNYSTARAPVTIYICTECKVHLCIDCFANYHKWKFTDGNK